MTSRRNLLAGSAAGLFWTSFGATRGVLAQTFSKASRIVVGFSPGGAPDVVARLLAERLKDTYAPTVFVDNKPGAGGRIAVEAVKKSEGDGATMLVTPNPMITIYPHVYRNLAYDPLRDLKPVTSLCSYPLVLTVGPGVPTQVKTLRDLVQWAKVTPGGASFGTPAAGSTLHFIGLVLGRAAGIELTHVPYKGGAEVMQDLLGGRIPLAITPAAPVVPHIRAGKVRALATTSIARSSVLPDVPSFKESGYPGLEMNDWIGLFVPSTVPAETIDRLNGAARVALQSDRAKETFASLMMEPGGESPADCANRVKAEYVMWGPIVKASGFVVSD